MLYYLYDFLDKFDVPGSNLIRFTSFRAIASILISLIFSLCFGNYFINYMRKKKHFEAQRDEKIDPGARNKRNIPSMGGVIIIVSTFVPCLLLGNLGNVYLLLMLTTLLLLGALGFWDDYIKIFRNNKNGISESTKIIGQLFLGILVSTTLYFSPQAVIQENIEVSHAETVEVIHVQDRIKALKTTIPFVKSNNFDYESLVPSFLSEYSDIIGWGIFVFVILFFVLLLSNGTNLNDGMDGMAAGNSTIIVFGLAILAYVSCHIELSKYLNIMYIPGSEELVVFSAALLGALIGFLWFNGYPAQIFMGDTGSLSLGGAIAVLGILLHKELLLLMMCGVFIFEAASVFFQRVYFKYHKRHGVDKRIFKATPIHDHFKHVSGLNPQSHYLITVPHKAYFETKISMRFWIVTVILVSIAIITLKVR